MHQERIFFHLMGKTLTQEDFIFRCNDVHHSKYVYDKAVYISARTPIAIKCPIHGYFTQNASSHLHGSGCMQCAIEFTSNKKRINPDVYLDECKEKHNSFYGYDKAIYVGCHDKITIFCPIHGYFEQIAANHKNGEGCSRCGHDLVSKLRTKTKEDFISQANIIHSNRFDYSKTEYIDSRNKITITCPIHGDFIQTPMDHIAGCGCLECSNDNNVLKKMGWVNQSKNKIGTFYIIRCFNENESFYKYGITYNGLKSRYGRKERMPYEYEIIRLIISTDKEYIWDLEKRFGRFKRNSRYSPIISFAGSAYECFSEYHPSIQQRQGNY